MNNKVLCLLLVFCLILNNFIITDVLADNTKLAREDDIYVYDFKLPVDSKVEETGWEIVDYNLTGPNYTNDLPYRNQIYGIQVSSKNAGEYIQFDLMVGETGYYDIEFMGGNYGGGGVAILSIDDQDIGIYDFYSATGIAAGKVEECNSLFLSKGIHKLTVKLKAPNENSGGRNMYPGELRLKKAETMPSLTSISLATVDSELQAGQESRLSVTGWDADEREYSLDSYIREFTSSDPSVAEVEPGGVIKAVGEGSADITVTVDMDGVLLKDSITVQVSGSILEIKYDFKDGRDSTIDRAGWEIADSNSSGGYRDQPYGIQVQSEKDEYIKIAFDVPVDGYYTVKFVGAGAGGGAIVDLYVDDFLIGQFDFYSKEYMPAKPQVQYKTLQLDRGVHNFTLKAVGKSESWGYNMYPSKLELERKASLPSIESVDLECDKKDIAVGQSARLTAKAVMSDGYTDYLRDSDATVEFSSQDTSVATIDGKGLIRGVAPGETKILTKVTLNGETKVGEFPIAVNTKRLTEVVAKLENGNVFVGGSDNIIVEAKLDDGSLVDNRDLELEFISEDEDVVSVDENGVITGISEGIANAEVKATLGGTTVTTKVEISVEPVHLTAIEIEVDKEKLFIGRTAKVKVTGTLSNGEESSLEDATIDYVSNNTEVLDVDQDGVVTAKGAGEAKIDVTVTMDDVELTGESAVIVVEDTSNIKNSKTRRTYYTDERIQAARENISKYDWAKSTRDGVVAEADKYVGDLEFLWNLVPGQSIPRSYEVNDKYICPSCKTDLRAEFSNYPWLIDVKNEPWKLKCPKCSILFPTNDFGAYYQSGLDEQGIFDPSLADRNLLKNELYPDKGEDWGVDDGYGFIDANGNKHTFIAYYAHWGVWYGGTIQKALDALKEAYVYTGDMKYARAGIVLLDRIADIYPSMNLDCYKPEDGFKNSDGGRGGRGKVIGSIWETGLVQSFIEAYDAFFDAIEDEEVIDFLKDKSREYDLDNPKDRDALIKKNIEDGIIREVYPAVKDAQIVGNFGMHQAALALAAVVLDSQPETGEWLDFTFQSGGLQYNPYRVTGGDILSTLIEKVDRDGHGNEASPGYNKLWLDQLRVVADVLEGYDGYEGADLYENPKFKKMFSAMYPLMLCERYTAQIGDSGGTGSLGLMLNLDHIIKAFEKYGDPILAQVAYYLNNNSTKGLHSDIFTRNPEKIVDDIEAIIATEGTLDLKSDNLTGYGFSVLRDGSNKKPFAGYGQPPQRPGNPKWLTYMIAQRQGENLESTFTSVIEPYKDERYIEDIEEVSVTIDGDPADEDVKAVKVTLKDGRIDYIVSALDKETLYTVDDKFTFQGFLGVYSEKDGKPVYSYINDGTSIGEASNKKTSINGTVIDFTKELSIDNQITIDTGSVIDTEDIVGRYIYIENDGVRNAVYRIMGVKSQEGSRLILDLADTALIRSFADVNDFAKGYIYDIKEGAKFTIPLSHELDYGEKPKEKEWVVADDILISGKANMQGRNIKDGIPGEYKDEAYVLGTPGEKRRLEGFMIELDGAPSDMMVVYRAYVQAQNVRPNKKDDDLDTIWEDDEAKLWNREGVFLAESGGKKRIEGVELKLINKDTGKEYEGYKIQYQTHIHGRGWDDEWAEDGTFAGTKAKNERVEGIRIRILKEQLKK